VAAPDPLAAAFATAAGVVTAFDDAAGAGTVRGDDGREWYLHATRIADGSRTITTGAAVTFRVAPGPTGLEAVDVEPIDADSVDADAEAGSS
jgi:cold shock CspA family protein